MPDSSALPPAILSQRDIYRVLTGVLLGMFLSALDQSIVATALPAMGRALGGLESLSWIVAVYLLTSTASTPIYGKLGDLYGRRLMILIAIFVFSVGSLLCGLAQNMTQIVAFRALQGIGAGGLLSSSQSVIADIIAPRERGRYQAYFSGIYAVATVAGPVVGGLFVDHLSWRWVFWINPPLGVVAFILCRRSLRLLPVPHLRRPIDFIGAVLLIAAVTCWLFVLTSGGRQFPWASPTMMTLIAGGIALAALLVVQERRAPEPLLPPRLFANAIVRQAWLASFVITMAQLATGVLMPSFLQLVLGVSAGQSGLMIVPLMIGTVVGSFSSGRIMRRTGRYRPVALSAICLAIAAQLLLSFEAESLSRPIILITLALVGLGFGPTFPAMMVAGQNGAELRDLGIVTSMIAFFRTLGGSFGIAILWSILIGSLASQLAAEHASALGEAILGHAGGGMTALPEASRQILAPALAHSYRLVFLTNAGLCAVAALLLATMREQKLRDEPAYQVRQRAAE
ncbi:MAG TPA: MDR family MFS transporter [Stellaceae bacterium]|nr:MDR family MFS transporter [Stellaceae bacterium]